MVRGGEEVRSLLLSLALAIAASAANAGQVQQAADNLRHIELDTEDMSAPRYIGGGLLSIVPGFGVGHAVQGRYASRGVYFTAIEAGIFGALFAGGLVCGLGKSINTDCQIKLTGVGAAAFLLVKAWETGSNGRRWRPNSIQ